MTQPVAPSPAQRTSAVLPKPRPDIEVGVGSVLPFSVPYKNVWEALRDDEVTVQQLITMRKTDGQARALFRLITLPIRSALKTATFVPEEDVEGGEDEAQFCQQMFTLPASAGGMSIPFNRVIAQLLLAVFDGFTAFELVYQSPDEGPLKGKWTIKKIAHRPADTLTFLIDKRGEFAGFRQQTMWQGQHIDRQLPADHMIYYAACEEEKAFYGQSYFQAAYYHWDKKAKLYLIAHIAAQRAAVGTRVGKLPPNPSEQEKTEFQNALSQLGVAQWMTMPDTFQVESMKETPGFGFLDFINHHNSQMSKSVLASFFDKEHGSGNDAKLVDFGQQSDALFLLMLETIMSEIEDVINQKIIPRFIDWNFGSQKYPRFRFGSLSQEQKAAMLDLFKTLAVAGQSLAIHQEFVSELEKQIAEEFGLEIDWETIEAADALAAEEQAQQEQLMYAQQGLGVDPVTAGGQTTPGVSVNDTAGRPQIPAGLLPSGFQLTNILDPATLALTDLAHDLLDDVVDLARGVPDAGVRRVRTAQGARIYGVPVGSIITRDMEKRTSGEGHKGAPYGGGIRDPLGDPGERKVLGGNLGAQGDLGGVQTAPGGGKKNADKPKAVYSHPDVPGARLLDFGDGTVAVEDSKGHRSQRQKFQIQAFLRLGWKTSQAKGTTRPAKKATPANKPSGK